MIRFKKQNKFSATTFAVNSVGKVAFISLLSMLCSVSLSSINTVSAALIEPVASSVSCGTGTYVISAYYSPVPGQARYATGAYESDIRLNGGGVMTASGTPVEAAMSPFVAAPPCMPFGTQLEIEGLGVHTVLDRGGAIKGNRLDIWMGYGDIGLQNALQWGKRTVFVSVDGSFSGASSGFTFEIGKKSLKDYQVTKAQDPLVFLRELGYGDKGEDVARLQQILKDLGYYKFNVTGTYDNNTKTAVTNFNKDNGVIESNTVSNSGRFGSNSSLQLKAVVVQNREKYITSLPSRNLGRGSKGDDVKKLQEFLYNIGLLSTVTGVYDSETVRAVVAFQIAEKVIDSTVDQGAGYFGPMTQIAYDRVMLSLENSITKTSNSEVDSTQNATLASISLADMLVDTLQEGATGNQVRLLQQTLRDLNYLNIEPSGYFGPITTNAVLKFQLKVGLINDNKDSNAGFVGPATRNALNKYINSRANLTGLIKNNVDVEAIELSSADDFQFTVDMKIGTTNAEVSILQKFLKDKGYFKGQIFTDYFGPMTNSALVKFKLDSAIEDVSDSDFVFDAKTRAVVNSML